MKSKLILGDNPFFGINHRSGEKANEYSSIKSDFRVAANVIEEASRNGINRLMVTTHAELAELLEVSRLQLDSLDLQKPRLSLGLPYAHKLNSVVADKGLLGLFTLINPYKLILAGIKDFLSLVFRQRKFPKYIFSEFIFSELKSVSGFDVEYVCFQNLMTDMILGLGRTNVFNDIADSLGATGAKPVFITMNPIELDKLLPKGVPICFHYNINGFMVQPSLSEVQEFIETTKRPLWAMGIMASGAIEPDKVWSDPYLKKFDKILYSTSKPERIRSLLEQTEMVKN